MKRTEYFRLHELVSKDVLYRYGEQAWSFFDPRLLEFLDWMREEIERPITINDWFWGGGCSQKGFRENLCELVSERSKANKLYCSAHMRGMAVDMIVEGMTTKEVHEWLRTNKHRLPHPIRVEKVSWIHIDVAIVNYKQESFWQWGYLKDE